MYILNKKNSDKKNDNVKQCNIYIKQCKCKCFTLIHNFLYA
jgi:hypothetical protein